jgi:type I restriction enzyme, R subunit
MIGRGTRKCADLFGPGQDKQFFYLFDYCANFEFFDQHPDVAEPAASPSLGTRLFQLRLALLAELDRRGAGGAVGDGDAEQEPVTDADVRRATATGLWSEVAAMNRENFLVRPWLRLVERFGEPTAWQNLADADHAELHQRLAGLPTALAPEPEATKRFDLLMLRLQLAKLRSAKGFARLEEELRDFAARLEAKANVPLVGRQLELLQDLQADGWWSSVTLARLEIVRRRLRELAGFVEPRRPSIVVTDFEDEMGLSVELDLPGLPVRQDFRAFKEKARAFLRAHEDHVSIRKLRTNRPLTPSDLAELERMLLEAGLGEPDELERAKTESAGLGLFVRSLVGLDRAAAQEAFASFIAGKTLTANQLEFLDLVIEHLTQNGAMDAALLYESPFTDLAAQGPPSLFSDQEVEEIVEVIEAVRGRAA